MNRIISFERSTVTGEHPDAEQILLLECDKVCHPYDEVIERFSFLAAGQHYQNICFSSVNSCTVLLEALLVDVRKLK
jgi:hypothetical protein